MDKKLQNGQKIKKEKKNVQKFETFQTMSASKG